MGDIKTEWQGLWNNRQGVYSGKTIQKKDIPPYARLIVRYNKFYESGSSRPKFVYCFAEGNAANSITMQTTNEEYITMSEAEELQDRYCFTYEMLQSLINSVACAAGGQGEYGEHIPSDFIDLDSTGLDTHIF